MTCQLRLPVARSPNAFVNSVRAATKGLTGAPSAGGGAPAPSGPAERPWYTSMKWGRRMARSAQGTEGVRDAEGRLPPEPGRDHVRHPDGEDCEDGPPAHH